MTDIPLDLPDDKSLLIVDDDAPFRTRLGRAKLAQTIWRDRLDGDAEIYLRI